jgi:hypothetical protein
MELWDHIPTRPRIFEVQLPLGHRLWSNHISLDVPLDCIGHTYFHVICLQPPDLVPRSVAILDISGRHLVFDSNQRQIERLGY